MEQDPSIGTGVLQSTAETAVALTDETTNYTDMESLDQQVKSMMIFSDKADPYKNDGARARICKVCGKEGGTTNIKNHIEANHITGISIPCDLCGKECKSRAAMAMHKSNYHRKNDL